ncbi:MAG: response regulator [Planctomycetaceae bacterium]|nr:response regulator [Planctomycetaceae bacterium]
MVVDDKKKGSTVYSMYGKPIEILLVEDNPEEAALTIETLKEGRVRNNVTHVEDGVDAITFLRRQGRYANVSRPDLILLDLKLRRKHGKEVLAEIKVDPELKSIPVVIMSKSSSERDILESYNLHANCYVQKPLDLDEFILSVRKIEDFWISFVKLPAA